MTSPIDPQGVKMVAPAWLVFLLGFGLGFALSTVVLLASRATSDRSIHPEHSTTGTSSGDVVQMEEIRKAIADLENRERVSAR